MQIETARAGVTLQALTEQDAPTYSRLMQDNAEHLTRFGDYIDEVALPVPEYIRRFRGRHPVLDFGVVESGTLVGSVSLVPVDPPRYGLGYWLAADACGRGLATLAVQAITAYARDAVGATDVFAGVTHGNHASVRVLERAGFHRTAVFDSYDRYHRPTP